MRSEYGTPTRVSNITTKRTSTMRYTPRFKPQGRLHPLLGRPPQESPSSLEVRGRAADTPHTDGPRPKPEVTGIPTHAGPAATVSHGSRLSGPTQSMPSAAVAPQEDLRSQTASSHSSGASLAFTTPSSTRASSTSPGMPPFVLDPDHQSTGSLSVSSNSLEPPETSSSEYLATPTRSSPRTS